eukprot:jgi/Mesen1/7128/ME000369S06442
MDLMISLVWCLVSVILAIALAHRGLKKGSLSSSGAVAAFVVGAATLTCGLRFGATLIAFYMSSSKLTKYKAAEKRAIEDDFKEGGQRTWCQVLANSFTATLIAISFCYTTGWRDFCFDAQRSKWNTALLGAFLGHYACCAGDTWASELGILSKASPVLITTFRAVPRGTNGGVSALGLAASTAGGAFVGLVFYLAGLITTKGCTSDGGGGSDVAAAGAALAQLWAVPLATAAGLLGSLVDSLLGATLQYSGFCSEHKKVVSKRGALVKHITGLDLLSNDAVNFISALVTAVAVGGLSLLVFSRC